jgi:hypothetical protein
MYVDGDWVVLEPLLVLITELPLSSNFRKYDIPHPAIEALFTH